jgi:serine/threonine protein kinase
MGIEYIVEFYDAFSNVEDASVALMVEYMDGGSLQDIVDNVRSEIEGTGESCTWDSGWLQR